jgi:hypothetical protein
MNLETTDLPTAFPVAGSADPPPDAGEEKRKKKGKKGKKRIGSERGIETMFRTSYQMHVEMSGLADSKANILISINGLIISVILAAISPKIDANPWLLLPTAVVLVSCLISMSFSILAARPRLAAGQGSAAAPRAEPDNLIFFGSFVGLDAAEYERRLLDLIRTRDELYRHMIRDIYGLGKVLERKFALLGRAYTIFLAGLILGVLLYLVVFVGVVFRGTPPL